MGNCQISRHGTEKLLMQQRPLESWRALGTLRIHLRRFKIKGRRAADQGFLRYNRLALFVVSWCLGEEGKRERRERG